MVLDLGRIELSPEQKQQLAELAKQSGKPWPLLLVEVLRAYRPRHSATKVTPSGKSFYDAIAEDRVIGIVEEALHTDVATNPKYREGFGGPIVQPPHAPTEAV